MRFLSSQKRPNRPCGHGGLLFPGAKQPWSETGHSPACSAWWSDISTPLYVFRAWFLINSAQGQIYLFTTVSRTKSTGFFTFYHRNHFNKEVIHATAKFFWSCKFFRITLNCDDIFVTYGHELDTIKAGNLKEITLSLIVWYSYRDRRPQFDQGTHGRTDATTITGNRPVFIFIDNIRILSNFTIPKIEMFTLL